VEERDFRIALATRNEIGFSKPLFITNFDIQKLYSEASSFTYKYNELLKKRGESSSKMLSAGRIHATAILHLLYQYVLSEVMEEKNPDIFKSSVPTVSANRDALIAVDFFNKQFPSPLLNSTNPGVIRSQEESIRGFFIHQVMVDNPALMKAAKPLVSPDSVVFPDAAKALDAILKSQTKDMIPGKVGSEGDIFSFLTRPSRLFPNSLTGQIAFIIREWAPYLSDELKRLLQSGLDLIREEEKDRGGWGGAPAPMPVTDYSGMQDEYEAFSPDTDWMPKVVMIAKCTLVWLDQLSKWYQKDIRTLDQIPDAELDRLRERGFTALWLIGLWERSDSSKRIKVLCGNQDAEASAYSLKNYEISSAIGGWGALENLRKRCSERGIRLASDMVPNHTGLDSDWMYNHPEYFISQDYSPFPSYTYNGPDVSNNPDIEIKIEDHYYSKTDAAVTFRRIDKRTGECRYVYHGNDGTTMPWNDTAQLDYLNPVTREAVIQQILHVARNFPIIRFDAAMTLAKKSIQRLWYPRPGTGGDIASRFLHAIPDEEFNRAMPEEFWREVVDRVAKEVPDTLLLAEAFWLMEGYFVRTLGMHRVYNSAFMNMLKNQENQKYRTGIKNTLLFEPEILKRYVNFMSNPDEETAIAQFGDGNRYFAICTILSTLPGLPMFGHGQIEGFHEKYGMEYKRAYWDEYPNDWLIGEHYRRIFPLLRRRYLFSGVDNFNLYDAWNDGKVEESIFSYANGSGAERNLVIVNNQYERVYANIKVSSPKLYKRDSGTSTETVELGSNLGLTPEGDRYMLYENFSNGLTYIMPSKDIFEKGYDFVIDGYDSKVLWNIREVKDEDGSYGKLCRFLSGNGVKNINIAVALLRLEPVFKILDSLRGDDVGAMVEKLIHGTLKGEEERSFVLSLAEVYERLCLEKLDAAQRNALPSMPRKISAREIASVTKKLSALFKKRAKTDVYRNYAMLAPEASVIIQTFYALMPFIGKDSSALDALVASDKLLLTNFFERYCEKLSISEDDLRQTVHYGALLSIVGRIILEKKDDTPLGMMTHLLKDNAVRDALRCNEYQGVTWYNKELLQGLIVVSSISAEIFKGAKDTFSGEAYVKALLEKETQSGYQLGRFLS